jgi:hypothetical protein
MKWILITLSTLQLLLSLNARFDSISELRAFNGLLIFCVYGLPILTIIYAVSQGRSKSESLLALWIERKRLEQMKEIEKLKRVN